MEHEEFFDLRRALARWAGMTTHFPGFQAQRVPVDDTELHAVVGGDGPPLLLLHGFPQTHLMWREIAPRLAAQFRVVCVDLTGYGASGCPASDNEHRRYAKRAIAADMTALMTALGHDRFAVAGHDRGGRVAYRLALDAPERVSRLAALDVLPGKAVWDRADDRFALGFWPFVLLAQDPPLPETVLTELADAVVAQALSGWSSPGATFPAEIRTAYVAALRDPGHAHAICEEYRAAAGVDREHDAADLAAGRKIAAPVLAIWSAAGPVGQWYADAGGPLAIWRDYAAEVTGEGVPGGHFFPEEHPVETAARLAAFFGG